MALLANIALFFALFLPLTFLVGLPGGWYVGPAQLDAEAYPLFIWLLGGLQLVLPCLLWVPVAHFTLRRARTSLGRGGLRRAALVLLPAGFLAVHVLLRGPSFLGPRPAARGHDRGARPDLRPGLPDSGARLVTHARWSWIRSVRNCAIMSCGKPISIALTSSRRALCCSSSVSSRQPRFSSS